MWADALDRIIGRLAAAAEIEVERLQAIAGSAHDYDGGVHQHLPEGKALGSALRAYHADRLASGEPVSWKTVVSGFTDPKPGHRVSPNPKHVAIYAELRKNYAMLERLHQHRRPIC